MNRRHFLGVLASSAAAVALAPLDFDPERALWVPGRKTIFLPSAEPFTPTEITIGDARLRVGDIVTIGGICSRTLSGLATKHPQQFVVVSDHTSHPTAVLRPFDLYPRLDPNLGKRRGEQIFVDALPAKDRGWSHKR